MKRIRKTALVLILLSCGVLASAQMVADGKANASKRPQTAPTYYDYTPLMQYVPATEHRQYPTAEEIAALGPLWPRVPWYQNAVFYYMKAARLETSGALAPPGSMESDERYNGDQVLLETWVALNQPALDALYDGLPLLVCQAPPLRRENGLLDSMYFLRDARHLARLCADAAAVAELNGKYDDAASLHLQCVRLGTQVRRGGEFPAEAVGVLPCTIGGRGLHRLISNRQVSDANLRRVIAACRAAESLPDELENAWEGSAVRLEIAFGVPGGEEQWTTLIEDARNGRPFLGLYESSEGIGGFLEHPPSYAEFMESWRITRAAFAKIFAHPIDDLVSDKPGMGALLAEEIPVEKQETPLFQFFAPDAFRSIVEAVALQDVHLRAVEVQAAIILYRQKQGKLPTELKDLVPDYLPAVPEDPFARAPMKYALTDYGWKVWSVGSNHKDDGGVGFSFANLLEPDLVVRSKIATTEQSLLGHWLVEENGKLELK